MDEKDLQLSDRIPSSLVDKDILKKFKATHDIIDRPEKFAEMFCGVAETQSAVRKKLADVLISSMQHDHASREEVKKVIKEIYDEDWKRFIRGAWAKIGLVIWTLIAAVIGAWINSKF